MTKYHVIIPAAGVGTRFQHKLPKQYHKILGKTLLEWSIAAFTSLAEIYQILVVVSPTDPYIEPLINHIPRVKLCTNGGNTRGESVLQGLKALEDSADNDWVLVHDAARCCIRTEDIKSLIQRLSEQDHGGILANIAVDTVKQVSSAFLVEKTIPRQHIYLAQTPQMFRFNQLVTALSNNVEHCTDEAQAIELQGGLVEVVPCANHNFKVTYQHDLELAQILLAQGSAYRDSYI